MKASSILSKMMAVLIVVFGLARNAPAQYRDYYGGWGMGPGMMGYGGIGWFGPLFMVFFFVLIIVAIILLIRWLVASSHPRTQSSHPENTALEILKTRYARGEIDKEEFETKKKDLL